MMKHPISQMTLHKHVHGINYFKWKHGYYLFSCFSGWSVRNKSYYCSVYFFTGNRQWQTYSSSTHEIDLYSVVLWLLPNPMVVSFKSSTAVLATFTKGRVEYSSENFLRFLRTYCFSSVLNSVLWKFLIS